MPVRRQIRLLVVACSVSVSTALSAEWRDVAPGIEYMQQALPGPVNVYVVRADRTRKTWVVDAMLAKGMAKGARETVPEMVRRYDQSVTSDGRRYDIKVAINGSYFYTKTGVPIGGEIIGGWMVRRFDEYSGGSALFWTRAGRPVLGGNVRNAPKWQHVRFADGTDLRIHRLNEPPASGELALYTWHYADRTEAGEPRVEVVARMSAPVGIMPEGGGVPGEIVAVHEGQGGTLLLYGQVILSGRGEAAEDLRAHAKSGEQLRVDLRLTDYGNEGIGLEPADWEGAYACVPAAAYILVNGNVPRHWEKKAERYAREGKKHGSVVQDPRTLLAFNDRYVFFVVVDGRSEESIGMTFTEAGNYCRDELKAGYAVTQDGGGSSTMWVDGQVRNVSSDYAALGKLRPVANGLFMAIPQPASGSTEFQAGAGVATSEPTELRLGPGSRFGVATTLPADCEGTVLSYPLSGIQAKGKHWWNCEFGRHEGWASEEKLRAR